MLKSNSSNVQDGDGKSHFDSPLSIVKTLSVYFLLQTSTWTLVTRSPDSTPSGTKYSHFQVDAEASLSHTKGKQKTTEVRFILVLHLGRYFGGFWRQSLATSSRWLCLAGDLYRMSSSFKEEVQCPPFPYHSVYLYHSSKDQQDKAVGCFSHEI